MRLSLVTATLSWLAARALMRVVCWLMRGLRLPGGVFVPTPSSFAAIWMGPGCVFYSHRVVVKQGIDMVEAEVASGALKLPDGMTAAEMTINRQAWALAHTSVAGRA
jgi:hypothetical protein